MTVRPDLGRVVALTAVCVGLGSIAAFAPEMSVVVRVAGWLTLIAALGFPVLTARTRVRVGSDFVEVRTGRSSGRFVRGRAEVREFEVPGGRVGTKPAFEFLSDDGTSVTLLLGVFAPRTRVRLATAVREALAER